jgi:hypothetical protein
MGCSAFIAWPAAAGLPSSGPSTAAASGPGRTAARPASSRPCNGTGSGGRTASSRKSPAAAALRSASRDSARLTPSATSAGSSPAAAPRSRDAMDIGRVLIVNVIGLSSSGSCPGYPCRSTVHTRFPSFSGANKIRQMP